MKERFYVVGDFTEGLVINMDRKKAIILSIKIAVIIILIVTFVIVNEVINERNEKKDTETYLYTVDDLAYDEEKGEVMIWGWCIKEGTEYKTPEDHSRFKVFLAENGKLSKLIEIPVEVKPRNDVTRAFGKDEFDYTYSGFYGTVKVDSDVKEKRYRVVFQYDSSVEKYYYTNRYLNKGVFTKEREQYD